MLITEHNVKTGKIVERKMNADELKQYDTEQAERIAAEAQAEAKATARQAILDRLGLTADEAKLLLG